jgi:transglycosylase-like protein with SLT domain
LNVLTIFRHNSARLTSSLAASLVAAFPTAASLVVLAALCSPGLAHAAERITLSNGFDVVCDHHTVVDGRVRVYSKPAATDYIELKATAVAGVETVPDPPVPAPPVAIEPAAPVALAQIVVPSPRITPDGKLTAGDLHQLLSKAGSEHNVDEDLLASVVKAESNGNIRATSRAGARGLMQLMPGTAQQLGVADSFAPDQNVRGGTAYLDGLLTRYHDNIALALAAYNAGPEAVDRYHGIPPYRETRAYVARVVHEFNRRVAARAKLALTSSRASNNGLLTASGNNFSNASTATGTH